MNDKRYRWILYVIVFVILGTITIQVYWNYKNYLVNKRQLVNDVQQSLDNAVETYFAELAENNTIAFAFDTIDSNFIEHGKLDSIMHKFEISSKNSKSSDTFDIEIFDGVAVYKGVKPDSFLLSIPDSLKQFPRTRFKSVFKDLHRDSTSRGHFRTLTSKVILSLTTDTLRLKNIDSLLNAELLRKKLAINYGLSYRNTLDEVQYFSPVNVKKSTLETSTRSPFLGNKKPYGQISNCQFTIIFMK